jgi:hypothetical protein
VVYPQRQMEEQEDLEVHSDTKGNVMERLVQ